MSKTSARIRLSGLEVTCRGGEPVTVPWHLILHRGEALHLHAARKVWSNLPRNVSISTLQSRAVRRLQIRGMQRRIRSGKLDLVWRPPTFSAEAIIVAALCAMMIVPLVPLLLQKSPHSGNTQAAILAALPTRYWIGLGLIILCAGGAIAVGLFKLAQLVRRRIGNQKPIALRASARGLTLTRKDGREITHSWDEVSGFDNGAFQMRDGARIDALLDNTAPELASLMRWVNGRGQRRREGTCTSPWHDLQSTFPVILRTGAVGGVISICVVALIEPEPGMVTGLIGSIVLAPLLLLVTLFAAALLPTGVEWLERRARERLRRSACGRA